MSDTPTVDRLPPFPFFSHLNLADADAFLRLCRSKRILTPAENARLADLGQRRYKPPPSPRDPPEVA